MSDTLLPSSFRDPSGSLFVRDGVLLRLVNEVYARHYEHLMQSGLYRDLVEKGLLVAHEEIDMPDVAAYKVLRPERVPFISYPYEWSFHQLQDAALTTLRIQRRALKFGMSLKDASAYNIQFVDGKPILIDTLSFEIYHEGEPWVAYRQFCQHFLAPLALMSYREARLGQLLRVYVDGIPLDLAAKLLPWRTRLRLGLLIHIYWHAKAQEKFADRPEAKQAAQRRRAGRGGMSLRSLRGLVDSLTDVTAGLNWEPRASAWANYYQDNSYTSEAMADKLRVVSEYLDAVKPTSVWDLGANTGRFSQLAWQKGASTIALDVDPACVDILYREQVKKGCGGILPLVMDLTNPSPGLGWAHRERQSLVERGPADTVLALALIHHLAISNNVPLDMVASFLSSICRSLIIEFVPKTDQQVQRLLASREDVFADYNEEQFERCLGQYFVIRRRERLKESERTVYLMEKR
jgi:hypothetical protein